MEQLIEMLMQSLWNSIRTHDLLKSLSFVSQILATFVSLENWGGANI